MGLFTGGTQIGVSIGTSSVKIAELTKAGKKYTLEHFGVSQLPDGAIENREIVNHMAVVDALRGLVNELKIKNKNVLLSISGNSVIVKKLFIEPVQEKELEDAILFEAEQYIPFDMKEMSFDYQVINRKSEQGKIEVIIVACKSSVVDMYRAAIQDSGLKLSCVDLDIFSLMNTFEANYPTDNPAAIVDIGASSMKFFVYSKGQSVFSRDISIGGRQLTGEIMNHLNINYVEAEMLKIDGNLSGQMPQEVADLVQVAAENIGTEIKRSIDFFQASNQGVNVGFILLSGGSSRILNLSKTVEELSGLPTQLLNPFANIDYNKKFFNDEAVSAITGLVAIPLGLAIRGFEG